MASHAPFPQADNFVTVDEIINHYHKRKSTVFFLVAALLLIFSGTFYGYSMLQYSTAKIDTYQTTVQEFAEVTVESEKCKKMPSTDICEKARVILETKDSANKDSLPFPEIYVAQDPQNFITIELHSKNK